MVTGGGGSVLAEGEDDGARSATSMDAISFPWGRRRTAVIYGAGGVFAVKIAHSNWLIPRASSVPFIFN